MYVVFLWLLNYRLFLFKGKSKLVSHVHLCFHLLANLIDFLIG